MTVVFVHGAPETADIWDGVRDHLAVDSVALRLPGFGSPRPRSFGATVDEYVQWLVERLRSIPGPIDLVGHDIGAVLTYRVVADPTVTVRSWVADSAGVLHPDHRWHELAKVWQTVGAGEEFVRQAVAVPKTLGTTLHTLGLPETHRAHGQFDAEMGSAVLDLYRSMLESRYRAWGPSTRTRAPGLVVHPVRDGLDEYGSAIEIARQLGATLYLMPGAGHWWMLDDPAAAAQALSDFWQSLFPATGAQWPFNS
ncbi:alpha/beta fold hydrolase [Nocardia sp. NPDC058666]|uniref:alpha/beta fold hydrolase n=1 Tax=Nocardia sp. NPDC058666 TaxID=3346587 RepID=UPI00364C9EC3